MITVRLSTTIRSFADDLVQYIGQSLFAVAGDSLSAARTAAMLAKANYEELPAVTTIAGARAAHMHIEKTQIMSRGEVDDALGAAPHRLKVDMKVGGQDHFYLEGQVALAVPGEDSDITIYSSTQHPSEVQHIVAGVLGIPHHAVTVIVRRLGGGLAGKRHSQRS